LLQPLLGFRSLRLVDQRLHLYAGVGKPMVDLAVLAAKQVGDRHVGEMPRLSYEHVPSG
jgi:hypothetical protein